jgi:predicted RNase H-like nuclease (RuvC/YqgF family)
MIMRKPSLIAASISVGMLSAGLSCIHVRASPLVISLGSPLGVLSSLESEVKRLKADNARLRIEIQEYQDEIQRRNNRVSGELKALSADLTERIETRFYDSVTRGLWLLGILLAVATAGGFWKLSDIIAERVREKVDERKSDFDNISEKLFDQLANFRVRVIEKEKELKVLDSRARKMIAELSRNLDEQRSAFSANLEEANKEIRSKLKRMEEMNAGPQSTS